MLLVLVLAAPTMLLFYLTLCCLVEQSESDRQTGNHIHCISILYYITYCYILLLFQAKLTQRFSLSSRPCEHSHRLQTASRRSPLDSRCCPLPHSCLTGSYSQRQRVIHSHCLLLVPSDLNLPDWLSRHTPSNHWILVSLSLYLSISVSFSLYRSLSAAISTIGSCRLLHALATTTS